VKSYWVRLLCLVSIVAAHGPQHHAFAHGHEQASEESDQCPVKVPHAESAKTHLVDPESDCLACQWQSGKALVDLSVDWKPFLQISKFSIDHTLIEWADDTGTPAVRGPPAKTG
jgi:hypothetical protein